MASFTPLVFSTTGGMGKEAVTFYRRLADLLSKRNTMTYSSTLAWLRCLLSFSLLRSATICASGEAVPSLTDHLMLHQNWALLVAPETFKYPHYCLYQLCPAHMPFVLGVKAGIKIINLTNG